VVLHDAGEISIIWGLRDMMVSRVVTLLETDYCPEMAVSHMDQGSSGPDL
jgi:hypothetical protein